MSSKWRFEFPDWSKKIDKNWNKIMQSVAASAQANRGMLFDKEGAYNGHPKWEGLKLRRGMILSDRGTLRQSIGPRNANGKSPKNGMVIFQADTVVLETNLSYARLMNDGGKVVAKNAKALKIPIPQGDNAGAGAKNIQKQATKESIADLQFQLSRTKQGSKKFHSIMNRIAKQRQKLKAGKGPVKFIFRKSVNVPARPFNKWNSADQAEMAATLANKIIEVLNIG